MPEPTAVIAADHRLAMRDLLDRLRDGGATSINVIRADGDQTWVRVAVDAATEWATEYGIPVTFIALDFAPAADEIHELLEDLLATHPRVDASVCLPEGLAVGIHSTLRELGHTVPDDIQLVSYVDSSTLAIVQPPISALDLRAKDAGRRAGEMLIALLEGGADHGAGSIEWLDVAYQERSSTRPAQK